MLCMAGWDRSVFVTGVGIVVHEHGTLFVVWRVCFNTKKNDFIALHAQW
jgi:hypothetical protein